jgi:serine/threonine-protein kinase
MDNATRPDGRAKAPRTRSAEEEPAVELARGLPRVGEIAGDKYRIEKVIGRGGMGVVYAAHHLVLDQRVALKLLLVDAVRGDDTVERFLREAQASARLRSDHVVRVMDAGALDTGHPFLAMEYLEGCDLRELLSLEGRQPFAETADYMLQALAALAQAHAAGIVHRDLKPGNLFLAVREDKTNILKVLDFGISKQNGDRAHWKDLTGQAVLGTPVYMSPDQMRSSKSVDPRADLWSLGVVMYELLTNEVPFDGEGPGEVFAAVLEKDPVSPRTHRPEVPSEWERIITRCLRRNPDERWQNAAELANALAPLGTGRWAHLVPGIRRALSRPSVMPKGGMALMAAAVAAARASMAPPAKVTSDPGAPRMSLPFPPLDSTGPLAGMASIPDAMGVPVSAASPVHGSAPQLGPLPESGTIATTVGLPEAPDEKATRVLEGLQFASVAPIRPKQFGLHAIRQPKVIALAAALLVCGIAFTSARAWRAPSNSDSGLRATNGATGGSVPASKPPALAITAGGMTGDSSAVGRAAPEVATTEEPLSSAALPPSAAPSSAAEPSTAPMTSGAPSPPASSPGTTTPRAAKASPVLHAATGPAKHPAANTRPKFLKSWN